MPPPRSTRVTPPEVRFEPTPEQRLVHALGNSLSAARLRLAIVSRDPACDTAQAANLTALNKILADAIDETTRLDDLLWKRIPD
jgi:hypothetical protein